MQCRVWILTAFTIGILVSGCQGLKTREAVRDRDQGRTESRTSPVDTSAQPDSDEESSIEDGSTQQPAAEFLGKTPPRVGLVLGPGGIKSYAHIGVLKQFERARIPIHSIVGLEWGSLAAMLYAEKASANDLDWRMNRLRESDLPKRNWPLGGNAARRDQYRDYFKVAGIEQQSISAFQARAGCAVVTNSPRLGRSSAAFLESGPVNAALERCMAISPLSVSSAAESAGPAALSEASRWLKAKGAELIVVVNVLGSGELLSPDLAKAEPGTRDLWNEVRRSFVGAAKAPMANWVLEVQTNGTTIDDFAGRRAAQLAGEKSAAKLTEKLAKQYGF